MWYCPSHMEPLREPCGTAPPTWATLSFLVVLPFPYGAAPGALWYCAPHMGHLELPCGTALPIWSRSGSLVVLRPPYGVRTTDRWPPRPSRVEGRRICRRSRESGFRHPAPSRPCLSLHIGHVAASRSSNPVPRSPALGSLDPVADGSPPSPATRVARLPCSGYPSRSIPVRATASGTTHTHEHTPIISSRSDGTRQHGFRLNSGESPCPRPSQSARPP